MIIYILFSVGKMFDKIDQIYDSLCGEVKYYV